MTKTLPTPGALTASGASYEGVTHAGLAIVAGDTGNVLLTQRTYDETDDPEVRETWEFPGGGLDVPETPFAGALREYVEETGLDLPDGEVVNGWRAGENGHYQGFVVLIPAEFDLTGWEPTDEVQAVAWVDLSDTDLPIRPEMDDFDVSLLDVSGNQPDFSEVTRLMTQGLSEDEPDLSASALPTGVIPIHGVLAPENLASGDGRGFNEAGLTRRGALRLPFAWQKVALPGHEGAITVGSIDRMMRKDGLIHWEGSLLDTPEAEEFLALLLHFGRYGVSIDADKGVLDSARSEAEGMTWFEAGRIAGATGCAIPAFPEAWVALGYHPEMPVDNDSGALAAAGVFSEDIIGERMTFDRGPGWVTNPVETKRIHDYWTKKGQKGYALIAWGTGGDFTRCTRLVGEKIAKNSPEDARYIKRICAQWHHDALGYWPGDLDKPGNDTTAEARAKREGGFAVDHKTAQEMIDASNALDAELDAVVESVDGLEVVADDSAEWEAVLVSSAAGATARPPVDYFHRHPDTGALVIEEPDEHGFRRTYGYAAEWGVCHVGMEGRCVEPPRTGSDDYPEFHLGRTKVEGNGFIHTGLLTYGVGHRDAQTILSESPTQQHFDNIKNAWASVRIGEDERGIWFSGVVLPKVDAEDLTLIQASGQVSGEWKHGALRACLTVNVPGFPVVSASAEYDENGNVVALAASAFGGVPDAPCNEVSGNDDPIGEVALAVMERIEARARVQALREADALARFAALKSEWKV